MRRWPEIYDKWVQLIDLILANGKVADLITILEPLIKVPGYWDWNWFRQKIFDLHRIYPMLNFENELNDFMQRRLIKDNLWFRQRLFHLL